MIRPVPKLTAYALLEKVSVESSFSRHSGISRITIVPTRLIIVATYKGNLVTGFLNSLVFGNAEQLISPVPSFMFPADNVDNPTEITGENEHYPIRLDMIQAGFPWELVFDNGLETPVLLSVILYGPAF